MRGHLCNYLRKQTDWHRERWHPSFSALIHWFSECFERIQHEVQNQCDLSSAEDSSKSFNADLGVDYPIFNVLILERFPRFSPPCFGLWAERWADEIVSTWAVRPGLTHVGVFFSGIQLDLLCKPTIRQWRIGRSCPPPQKKRLQNITKMLNIWTKTTVVVHTSVTLKTQMFITRAFFSPVTHTRMHPNEHMRTLPGRQQLLRHMIPSSVLISYNDLWPLWRYN